MAGKKILVIDDDPTLLKVQELSLSSFGFEVDLADSGLTALEKIKNKNFDAIILDYYMPKMDGPTVCQKLRKDPEFKNFRRLPILLLTGKAETKEELAQEVFQLGANDFLEKPFELKELVEKINKLVS